MFAFMPRAQLNTLSYQILVDIHFHVYWCQVRSCNQDSSFADCELLKILLLHVISNFRSTAVLSIIQFEWLDSCNCLTFFSGLQFVRFNCVNIWSRHKSHPSWWSRGSWENSFLNILSRRFVDKYLNFPPVRLRLIHSKYSTSVMGFWLGFEV